MIDCSPCIFMCKCSIVVFVEIFISFLMSFAARTSCFNTRCNVLSAIIVRVRVVSRPVSHY